MESFKYTKEALRVTRATVESNYYRYILSVSMASIEISFSREVKKKKKNCSRHSRERLLLKS